MSIRLFNSLSGQKEAFTPIDENRVRMYVCGMTVYDYCHIGHARVMVGFDVITRYLRHRGYEVDYVRNITDVDDKIFRRAGENDEHFSALTERFIAAMHEDEKALGNIAPDQEPRATAHMDDIIALISTLIDNGFAYPAANGDVYYAVRQFDDYGKLSKKNIEDLIAGASERVDAGDAKRDPLDFALWKAAKEGEESWASPWGQGRPGWHIECSAMSTCCLGETFDIHGGGPDLKFPHHENEIAQSEAATGKPYVNYWMHAGAVRVNKEKMSKSLGNFFTIREVLEKYPAEVVRYFLISSHYRSQVDYSEDSLAEAKASLDRFYHALRGAPIGGGTVIDDYKARFEAAMDDDFNSPGALSVMFEVVKELNLAAKAGDASLLEDLVATLRHLADILGILQTDPDAYFKAGASAASGLDDAQIDALVAERWSARQNKNWAESDRIRDALAEQGVVLDDSREGTTWRRQ